MKILYVFPHPDDESFGPAGAINQQVNDGNDVYLLTLTKGGATQVRHKLNLSIEEMGIIRHNEMLDVKKVLHFSGFTLLDYPDSRLKELDPRIIERDVQKEIERIQPNIVITYPVHGGSGFHDHLVTYAVVKRVFLEMKDNGAKYLKRLAFFTMPDNGAPSFMKDGWPRLKLSESELIDVITPLNKNNVIAMRESLLCYETYQEMVEKTGVIEKIGNKVHFEIAFEDHYPPLKKITDNLIL
ncbi:PIG-L deacetylase family protein [Wocania ichthyoenteri]|uniref:PIG-L deacetylase family protein n=1 Tax=Wocania ichthyoenteri TaxID=1230531 RepID=UPI00053E27C3|nr:PIG-L family deacetylase [Wocania ichthyoenteri]